MQSLWLPLMAIACLWWLVCAALLPGFPANLERWAPANGWFLALGPLQWIPTVLASVWLRASPPGALQLLYVFVLVWAADTGAYFAGRALGRRKLAPAISPSKTQEGALGGLVLCGLWAVVGGVYIFEVSGWMLGALVGWSTLAAGLSIVGDLSESMFKRRAGLKDSGMLLPGHGGMLDRIDSLMAVAPFMALGLRYLAER
jgi:phosphatidate cytidylyltransferase